jgi:isopentenyldiphosphate isomerase
MIGKAYFGAYVIADASAQIVANAAEVHCWEWVSREEFLTRIETNSTSKLPLLQDLITKLNL